MPSSWGNAVGRWRCGVEASVVSMTDETATVRVACVWQCLSGRFYVDYNSAWVSCEGQAFGAEYEYYVQATTGGAVTSSVMARDFVVARLAAPREVECAASFVMPDVQPGSSRASLMLAVPGQPCEVPAAPTGAAMSALVDGSLALSWAPNPDAAAKRPYSSQEVDARRDGGAWGGVAGFPRAVAADARSCSLAAPAADSKYEMRVRALNDAGASAWAQAGPLYTVPAAPRGLAASFSGGAVQLTWSGGGRYAASYEVQRSADGSAWEALATVAASPAADASPPGGTPRYRVRSRLDDGTASAWSECSVTTWTGADYPSVAVTAPAGAVGVRPAECAWTASPGSGALVRFLVELVVGGRVVERRTLGGSARSCALSLAELPDGGGATVRVTATNSNGLSGCGTRSFSADYLPPAPPSVSVSVEASDLSVTLSVADPEGAGFSPAARFEVRRGGELVGEGAGPDFRDPHPPIGAPLDYEVVAWAETGKSASASCQALVRSSCGCVSFDGGGPHLLRLALSMSESVGRGGAAYHFADGGAGLPEWYGSPDVDAEWSLSAVVPAGDLAAMRADMRACGTAWFRDPSGLVVHGHPSWSWGRTASKRYAELSATVTEVV